MPASKGVLEIIFLTFPKPFFLRAICEVAATPNHEDGLFGEIVNVILNASASIGSEMGDLVSSWARICHQLDFVKLCCSNSSVVYKPCIPAMYMINVVLLLFINTNNTTT